MSPPRLPPELVDEIIAFIAYDFRPTENYKTLLNCALACRNWVPASRSRLLKYVEIGSGDTYNSFAHNVLLSPRMNTYLASTKAAWLGPFPYLSLTSPDEKPEGWIYRFIHVFAGHLPKLEQLTIRYADGQHGQPPHPRTHMALSRFSSLKQMTLFNCSLPSAQMLRRMVTSLSASLRDLSLYNVKWPRAQGETSATYTPCARGPALERLTLTCHYDTHDCVAAFLWWLSLTPTRSSLRDFSLTRLAISRPPNDYITFTAAVAPGLVKLDVLYIPIRDIPASDLTSIKELTLAVGWFRRREFDWHAVARLLLALPLQSRLHCLKFLVKTKGSQWPEAGSSHQHSQSIVIEEDGLELVEASLQGDKFKDLKRMYFDLNAPAEFTQSEVIDVEARMLEVVQRKMPTVAAKGIISVCFDCLKKKGSSQFEDIPNSESNNPTSLLDSK